MSHPVKKPTKPATKVTHTHVTIHPTTPRAEAAALEADRPAPAVVAPVSDAASPEALTQRNAYEASLAAMKALDPATLSVFNVAAWSAVTTVWGALPAIREHLPEMKHRVPQEPLAEIDHLEQYLLALVHANAQVQFAGGDESELPAVYEQAIQRRNVLLSDLRAAATRGLIAESKLEGLTGGMGYSVVGPELYLCVSIAETFWSKIEGRTAITRDELTADAALQVKLIQLLSDRGAVQPRTEALENRQRVFTLITRAYGVARRCMLFIRADAGDGEQLAPPLHTGSGRAKAAKSDPAPAPVASAPPVGSTVAAAPATPVPPVTPTALHEPAPAFPGMPGGSPFKD